jgi:hypothetical protein
MKIEARQRIEKLFRRPLTDEQAIEVFAYVTCRLAENSKTTAAKFLKTAAEVYGAETSNHSSSVLQSAQVVGPVASKQSR